MTGNETMNREGHWWVFNTVAQWQEKQFTWWSVRKIEVLLQDLEKMGLITTKKFYSYKWDQKKWYTVNYDAISTLAEMEIAFVDWKMPELVKHLAKLLGGKESLKASKTASTRLCSINATQSESLKKQNMVDDLKETKNNRQKEETKSYIKGSTDPDSTDVLIGDFASNESMAIEDGEQSGTASIGKNPDSCGGGETHETQNETELYATPWNPKAEGFRVGGDGWAVMPQAVKHKLVRFMTTRGMQLELLQELDEEFSAEWKFNEEEGKYDLWVTTTHARSGWVDDVLGTVKSTGANWIEYNNEDDDYCSPGNASLRVLRNWGYESGAVSQSWYNERLKELWDDSTRFCKQYGSEAKSILGSRPLWECIELELELE
jgi:hypothetical protein